MPPHRATRTQVGRPEGFEAGRAVALCNSTAGDSPGFTHRSFWWPQTGARRVHPPAVTSTNGDAVLYRDLRVRGLTRTQVRNRAWTSPTRSVHVPHLLAQDLASRCRAVMLALPPDTSFGHLTEAALLGWWLPWLPLTVPLFATTRGAIHVQRPGIYVRRSPRTPLVEVDGQRVVEPAYALAELATDLALIDLVVIVDSALRHGHCSTADLRRRCECGGRGSGRLRRAVELADPRSESPWETILRLVHTLSGVAAVDVQPTILDADGAFLARADLRIRGTRRLPEYDGEAHRDREQHHRDLARDKTLTRAAWERYGYTSREIEHGAARVIGDAQSAVGAPTSSVPLRRWLREASGSTVTASGRHRLAERLRRYAEAWRTGR